MSVLLKSCMLSGATVVAFVAVGYGINMAVGPTVDASKFQYRRTALVTAAYFAFFYFAVFFQSMAGLNVWSDLKRKKEEKLSLWEVKYGPVSYKDKRIVASSRVMMNTLEQMGPFLVGLWLLAAVGGDAHASVCGWWYLAFRCAYPVLYVANPNLIVIATLPNYFTVCYMWVVVVLACLA